MKERDIKWLRSFMQHSEDEQWNPVKTKITLQAGVYKCLLPFICFSYGVYLSVLVPCYAYRGNIVYLILTIRLLDSSPEPEPFKVHNSRWGVITIFDSW